MSWTSNIPAPLAVIWDFPFFPEQASTVAHRVDAVYLGLCALTVFFSVLIAVLLIGFAIRYRAGSPASRANPVHESSKVEAVWVGVPFLIAMALFVWAAREYFVISRIPPDTMDIYVYGKQWMWKMQHPSGKREINELHVPVGVPIKVILTSQDVIHDLYVPAFRVKMDAIPGRYTYVWFEANKPGTYHLFCAEYCGADHSRMIGKVIVQTPEEYQRWLMTDESVAMADSGGTPFVSLGCNTCHLPGDATRAPLLEGLFGKSVEMSDGKSVTVDESYIRESILNPTAKVVKGYVPMMPTYAGRVDEEQLSVLVEYVKSLGKPAAQTKAEPGPGKPDPGLSEKTQDTGRGEDQS